MKIVTGKEYEKTSGEVVSSDVSENSLSCALMTFSMHIIIQ